jgi:hypothetical protein
VDLKSKIKRKRKDISYEKLHNQSSSSSFKEGLALKNQLQLLPKDKFPTPERD